jgi:hypothetical protein
MVTFARHERLSPDQLAWHVYQLEDVLKRTKALVDEGLRPLRQAHEKRPDDVFRIRPGRIESLRQAVDELRELAGQAQTFVDQLPSSEIRVTCAGAAREALRELGEGAIYDGERVQLVGRMVPRTDGLRALARGLRATDAHESWRGLSLKNLLRAFDRMTPQLIRLIVTDIGLTPGDEIVRCSPAQINRLAARLDDYVSRGT